ncbi:hypothetical protein F503_00071 [Ophiostoma piceae UAMH 11346]|uniref:Uncharacterized protein n=1 Tax=Ophiostoma piceae (strain UAMH 11346) TaxID=1262450 RepID=S3BWJ6_OPHP1|nr:hypothetical protein F503_00071 [Ophiostoma piceae UAMH 11346]
MCEYEEFIFSCGCSQKRLNSYCHLARNDLNHQCFSIKKLRHVWEQQTECKSCIAKRSSYTVPNQQGAFASGSWQQQQQHAQYR